MIFVPSAISYLNGRQPKDTGNSAHLQAEFLANDLFVSAVKIEKYSLGGSHISSEELLTISKSRFSLS